MRKIGSTMLAGAAAAMTLASCGEAKKPPAAKKGSAQAGAHAHDQGATQAAVTTTAPPAPRPGLWIIATTGAAQQTTRLCVDEASAARIGPGVEAPGAQGCAERRWTRRADGALVFTSACDLGDGGRRTATAVLTGEVTRRYHMAVEETTRGAAAPSADGVRSFAVEADWRGPCPAGWRGGDVGLANGARFNLLKGK